MAMQSYKKLAVQLLCTVACLFCGFFWLIACFRWTALFFAIGCVLALPFLSRPRKQLALNVLVYGFLVLSLMPADISFRTRLGPPKLMRVVYGLPMGGLIEQEKRGEVILGGCVVNGYVPFWVLVW